MPVAPVDRGAIEAAAHEIEVREGERAWRVDRRDRADAAATARALAERLGARHSTADHRVHHLEGHRMLIVAPTPARTLGAELLGVELRSGVLRAGLNAGALGAETPGPARRSTICSCGRRARCRRACWTSARW